MNKVFILLLMSLLAFTSCLSPNHSNVKHYDLGLRENTKELPWKVGAIAFSGYRSEKILDRNGQALNEDHNLRWKEEPDNLLKNFWLVNYTTSEKAIDVNVRVLRFEFYNRKAEVLVDVIWDKGKKSKRVFARNEYKGLTQEEKIKAMADAVDTLTAKITEAVK